MNIQRRTPVVRDQKPGVGGQWSACAPRSPLSALRAFTLIELLVVIGIIAILLGIVVPMYSSVREKAKYTKAKVAVKNLETAFKAYLDHYRVWPKAFGQGAAQEIDENVVKILRGENDDKIAFYEFESTNSANGALDPWSNPYEPASTWKAYRVQVDKYDNKIDVDGQLLYRTVIVWSVGTNRSDVLSEPATKEGNVKSWD